MLFFQGGSSEPFDRYVTQQPHMLLVPRPTGPAQLRVQIEQALVC